jgi:spermidine/putrescine transport system permease protein
MEAASLPVGRRRSARRRWRLVRPLAFVSVPTGVLFLFFLAPMAILAVISFEWGPLSGQAGATFHNFTSIISDPLYRRVTLTTFEIATIAMVAQLIVAIPVAYILAFRAGRFEVPLLLMMVLADELNPMVRIYAWRMLLGRDGIINSFLTTTGLAQHPIDALLFSKFAVIVVLSTSYVTYTIIPIYAAMKAIDAGLFEAARDLGASWVHIFRRILVPLIMPGILIALLLVYIPLFTDFASPTLVGGTSGYMLGNAVQDLVLESGDLNGGAALSLMMLIASGIFALIAYRLAKIRQLES